VRPCRPAGAWHHGSVQQRLPSLLDHPIAFAHRGARAHAPENTLEAFALALKLGATGLESDVWRTADGILVLDHDGVVKSRLRTKRIGELSRADLPGHIPALVQLIETCGDQFHLSLDLKQSDLGAAVVADVRSVAPALLPRLWLCHPRWEVLRDLRAEDPTVRLVDSTRLERIKEGPERRMATLAGAGIDAINLHHTDWNGGLVALAHRFERVAFGWGYEFDHHLGAGLRMGLDGVHCDWVDRMMDAYGREVGRPQL
jgi:glycerophosphoryl diester phosphodiesterase